ncbi:three-Cys-motif partner protein TcmP [Pontibacter sp. BAB1700]|uniref:three-Cys-motif partner protein TcmP n=1 Tax=Pontibacter sp. BAB1700 TaxID=1144253 RepID=UPI00026BD9E0|nr:three-Cys-motif partner protein TcmP [Pontibacter sp. BAB1700]EJF10002.1 hypothetical protein O71_11524 [Pontibacter sp. BAB1700]
MAQGYNKFGGAWTQKKINIFMEYLNAYLTIMNKYDFELVYFDGFAGCGTIETSPSESPKLDFGLTDTLIEGVATKVLNIDHPKQFDIYYLVELDSTKCSTLKTSLRTRFPDKSIYCVSDDCNLKLKDLADFLRKNPGHRALAFIDPFGMALDWESLEACAGLGIDLWVLLPSGVAANRLLTADGNISEAWMGRLERFLGLDEAEIRKQFYRTSTTMSLFGDEITQLQKQDDSINKIAELYSQQLGKVWEHVSKPYVMRSKNRNTLYHFICASNNKAGLRISNDIIRKYSIR